MANERNFRSSYLERVGIKGVEEKKSLEILLKEQPLHVSKLLQFCQRFPVPAAYRTFLWKILLGILPAHQETHPFVMHQLSVQYNDLYEALEAMRKVTQATPMAEVHLKMFLIEEGRFRFEEQKMKEDPNCKMFLALSNGMYEVTDDPIDLFWLTVRFYQFVRKNNTVPLMKEKVEHYLRKEDTEGRLNGHLSSLRAFQLLPINNWFNHCYAGVLPGNTFERIWDKVIGGSNKILVYTAVAIFLTFKRPLLSMNNIEDIKTYLQTIPEDSGDIIVSKAIEIWQKYGSVLVPSKGDSPNITDRAPS